jgi:hypothetical protein
MTNVKVEELTIEGVVYVPKNALNPSTIVELDGTESVWHLGIAYLIRTVTMIQLGRLKKITDKELVLADACWVADTGRFNEALKTGTLKELEMFQRDVIVGRGAIVDATEWVTDLPKSSL